MCQPWFTRSAQVGFCFLACDIWGGRCEARKYCIVDPFLLSLVSLE